MVDAGDLKSSVLETCRFESGQAHHYWGGSMPYTITIQRESVLRMIAKELTQMNMWAAVPDFDHAAQCSHRADALMNLLEKQDCGMIGGYDIDQPPPQLGIKGLNDRYTWLKRKEVPYAEDGQSSESRS
jgi:hypothetical protein